MKELHPPNPDKYPHIKEIPERLNEQHILTTKALGFLIHPNIQLGSSRTLKIADIGTGTGIWLLDVASTLPATCQLTGYDTSSSGFPPPQVCPPNVSFRTHSMYRPFPTSELGTYDLVAVRFVSSATKRAAWSRVVANLATLLKPGVGWLQWIDSCNFALYNAVPGTARTACRALYDGAVRAAVAHHGSRKDEDEVVIGLLMREKGTVRREEVFREAGLLEVQEDVFSTDRLQEPELQLREKGTRNIIGCFVGCLEASVGVAGSGWTKKRIEMVKEEAMREIDQGVYHTLDQICIVGRRAIGGVLILLLGAVSHHLILGYDGPGWSG